MKYQGTGLINCLAFTTVHRKVTFSFVRLIVLSNIIKSNIKSSGIWAVTNSRDGFFRRVVSPALLCPLRISLFLVATRDWLALYNPSPNLAAFFSRKEEQCFGETALCQPRGFTRCQEEAQEELLLFLAKSSHTPFLPSAHLASPSLSALGTSVLISSCAFFFFFF